MPDPTRRGRSSIDDEPALRLMALLLDRNENLSVWKAANEVAAAGSGGASPDGAARRLHRKFKRREREYRERGGQGRDRLLALSGHVHSVVRGEEARNRIISLHREIANILTA